MYIKKLINEIKFNLIFHKILFFHLLSQKFPFDGFHRNARRGQSGLSRYT